MIYFHKLHAGVYFGIVPHKGTVWIKRQNNSWNLIANRVGKISPVFVGNFDKLRIAKNFCYTYEPDLFGR